MNDEKPGAAGEPQRDIELENIVHDLADVKKRFLDFIQPKAKSSSVIQAANGVVTKLDEAYMYIVVPLDAALQQVSPENVAAQAEAALAAGKVTSFPGGEGKGE